MDLGTPLLPPMPFFAGGLLHSPLVEAGRAEVVEGSQNIAYAFPPCLAGLQGGEVEGIHEQGVHVDAWDKVQRGVDDGIETWALSNRERRLMKVYTPKVPGEDLVGVVQQLVGNNVVGESLEYAGHVQIGWGTQTGLMGRIQGKEAREGEYLSPGGVQVQGGGSKSRGGPSPGGSKGREERAANAQSGLCSTRSQPQKGLNNQQTHRVESMQPGSRDLESPHLGLQLSLNHLQWSKQPPAIDCSGRGTRDTRKGLKIMLELQSTLETFQLHLEHLRKNHYTFRAGKKERGRQLTTQAEEFCFYILPLLYILEGKLIKLQPEVQRGDGGVGGREERNVAVVRVVFVLNCTTAADFEIPHAFLSLAEIHEISTGLFSRLKNGHLKKGNV
ncbi:hypothetical protein EDD15DRAFT_2201916 [Pisolithus albus]|nr:hypothetical protein EDD15DRAFT_2201916 [Pisolithus albus]